MNKKLSKSEKVYRIKDVFMGQRFYDWYCDGGRFDTWIKDSEAGVSEADINKDIEKMFGDILD